MISHTVWIQIRSLVETNPDLNCLQRSPGEDTHKDITKFSRIEKLLIDIAAGETSAKSAYLLKLIGSTFALTRLMFRHCDVHCRSSIHVQDDKS